MLKKFDWSSYNASSKVNVKSLVGGGMSQFPCCLKSDSLLAINFMSDPTFLFGSRQVATVTFTNTKSVPLDYIAELYLVDAYGTKRASAGLVPFSIGPRGSTNVNFGLVMPTQGPCIDYIPYIDVYIADTLNTRFISSEIVKLIAPPGLGICLFGKVTEKTTGKIIPHANVDAYVENLGHRGAFTDSDGNYCIENLVEGRAFVTVTAKLCETWTQHINITAPGIYIDWMLTPITTPPRENFSVEITGASNANPQVKEYVAIYYKVKNVGTVSAIFGHIDYANGTPFASIPLQGVLLSPGQTYEGSITVGKTVPETTVFQIAVTTCPHPSGISCGYGYMVLEYSNTITITWR